VPSGARHFDVHLLLLPPLLAGKWGYYALGAYGSLCMAIFMVKTMKRVIFQETRTYGEPAWLIAGRYVLCRLPCE
jgi:hypothetical protein